MTHPHITLSRYHLTYPIPSTPVPSMHEAWTLILPISWALPYLRSGWTITLIPGAVMGPKPIPGGDR